MVIYRIMIIGEYYSKLTNKKRVAMPKKFREQLGDELILTRGYENSLVLVDQTMWKRISSDIENGSFINSSIRNTTRFLIGGAVEVIPDQQGRFVIPDPLYNYASMKQPGEIVFVGLINWIEIWELDLWNSKLAELAKDSAKIADELTSSEKKNG